MDSSVTAESAIYPAGRPDAKRDVFNHPRGLFYLSLTESWERFSFYGMQAILILYMVDELLLPGRAETVLGFAAFRSALENLFGPMTTVALAAQISGMYGGLVHITPVLGGFIGDRWLGQKKTVILGGALMVLGHALMAVEAAFLIALVLLVLGCGCLKGNISAQVGGLYARDDHRRDAAFVIFNLGINLGVLFGPLVCGTLGEHYGYHYGFGAAAGGMVIGLILYLAGGRHIPEKGLRTRDATRAALTREDWKRIGAILAVLLIGAFYATAYYQTFGVMILWIRDVVDREFNGFTIPATWFLGLGGLFIIVLSPIMLRIWRWQAKRNCEPGDLAKIGWGSAMGVVAYALLAFAAASFTHPHIAWVVVFFGIATLGFLWYWPLTLAIVSKTAPLSVNSMMMGIAYLALAVGSNMVGLIGQFYDKMSPAQFWLIQAGISAAGAVLILIFGPALSRILKLR